MCWCHRSINRWKCEKTYGNEEREKKLCENGMNSCERGEGKRMEQFIEVKKQSGERVFEIGSIKIVIVIE